MSRTAHSQFVEGTVAAVATGDYVIIRVNAAHHIKLAGDAGLVEIDIGRLRARKVTV